MKGRPHSPSVGMVHNACSHVYVGTEASEKGGEVIQVCGKDGDNTVSFPSFPLPLRIFHLCMYTGTTYTCTCICTCFLFLSQRAFVEVQWAESEQQTIHMVGHEGKVRQLHVHVRAVHICLCVYCCKYMYYVHVG